MRDADLISKRGGASSTIIIRRAVKASRSGGR